MLKNEMTLISFPFTINELISVINQYIYLNKRHMTLLEKIIKLLIPAQPKPALARIPVRKNSK
jgi:hypothetical protein